MEHVWYKDDVIITQSMDIFFFSETNMYILVISNMKDLKIPSFKATGHDTYEIELNVYLSIIAFKLMTPSLIDP